MKLSYKDQLNNIRRIKCLADRKYGAFSSFCQFCLVGLSGMVVDLSCYSLLLALAIPIGLARALAIWVAMTWTFFLNRNITFASSASENTLEEYLRFVLACSFGAIVSWGTAISLGTYIHWFQHHLLLAAFLGICSGTISNFLASMHWVFSSTGRG